MTGLIDTHAHLTDDCFMENIDSLMREMTQNGIDKIICVGCDLQSAKKTLALCEQFDNVYAEIGFHPSDTKDITEQTFEQMKELLEHKKVVALGEIGFDFYWDSSPRDVQQYWFEKQLDLAYEKGLPVVIHSRDATEKTLEVLKNHKIHRGVFHCFSGSVETMRQVIKMGFSISLGGVVTFKNARNAVECAKEVPLDKIMLETDCPYMAPEPHRGKTNRPDYTLYVAKKIAELKGMGVQEFIDITNKNAKEMFKI